MLVRRSQQLAAVYLDRPSDPIGPRMAARSFVCSSPIHQKAMI
jgi:hypothetical protein